MLKKPTSRTDERAIPDCITEITKQALNSIKEVNQLRGRPEYQNFLQSYKTLRTSYQALSSTTQVPATANPMVILTTLSKSIQDYQHCFDELHQKTQEAQSLKQDEDAMRYLNGTIRSDTTGGIDKVIDKYVDTILNGILKKKKSVLPNSSNDLNPRPQKRPRLGVNFEGTNTALNKPMEPISTGMNGSEYYSQDSMEFLTEAFDLNNNEAAPTLTTCYDNCYKNKNYRELADLIASKQSINYESLTSHPMAKQVCETLAFFLQKSLELTPAPAASSSQRFSPQDVVRAKYKKLAEKVSSSNDITEEYIDTLIKFKNTIFLAYVPIDQILSNNSIGIMWRLKLVMLANHCRESFSKKGDPTEQAKSDLLSTRDILVKYYPEINEFRINEITSDKKAASLYKLPVATYERATAIKALAEKLPMLKCATWLTEMLQYEATEGRVTKMLQHETTAGKKKKNQSTFTKNAKSTLNALHNKFTALFEKEECAEAAKMLHCVITFFSLTNTTDIKSGRSKNNLIKRKVKKLLKTVHQALRNKNITSSSLQLLLIEATLAFLFIHAEDEYQHHFNLVEGYLSCAKSPPSPADRASTEEFHIGAGLNTDNMTTANLDSFDLDIESSDQSQANIFDVVYEGEEEQPRPPVITSQKQAILTHFIVLRAQQYLPESGEAAVVIKQVSDLLLELNQKAPANTSKNQGRIPKETADLMKKIISVNESEKVSEQDEFNLYFISRLSGLMISHKPNTQRSLQQISLLFSNDCKPLVDLEATSTTNHSSAQPQALLSIKSPIASTASNKAI